VNLLGREGRDAFEDLGNKCAGCAAISLSTLVGRRPSAVIGNSKIMDTRQMVEYFSKTPLWVASHLKMSGRLRGYIQLLFSRNDAIKLADLLVFGQDKQTKTLYEEGRSAIKEATNILASSYFMTFQELTQIAFSVSVPDLYVDASSGVISGALADAFPDRKEAVGLVTSFVDVAANIHGFLCMIPDPLQLDALVGGMVSPKAAA
jgi:chemotaxis protein CheY-P-specific phosphatase CheC